jgi:hypothetical protein
VDVEIQLHNVEEEPPLPTVQEAGWVTASVIYHSYVAFFQQKVFNVYVSEYSD